MGMGNMRLFFLDIDLFYRGPFKADWTVLFNGGMETPVNLFLLNTESKTIIQ